MRTHAAPEVEPRYADLIHRAEARMP
jgi:hypothetical protein